jgi:hypothetical protein
MRTKTKVISAKVTEDEYVAFNTRARTCGLSPSQFARRELMASIDLPVETRFLAAELLAFQETFLALILASVRGDDISDASLAKLRTQFDSIKYSLVERALQKATSRKESS